MAEPFTHRRVMKDEPPHQAAAGLIMNRLAGCRAWSDLTADEVDSCLRRAGADDAGMRFMATDLVMKTATEWIERQPADAQASLHPAVSALGSALGLTQRAPIGERIESGMPNLAEGIRRGAACLATGKTQDERVADQSSHRLYSWTVSSCIFLRWAVLIISVITGISMCSEGVSHNNNVGGYGALALLIGVVSFILLTLAAAVIEAASLYIAKHRDAP